MNKTILSAFGAFLSLLCAIVLLTAFAKSGEVLFAVSGAIFASAALYSIGFGIEDTKLSDKLSDLFGEEAGDE